jgi:hypothetical protein
MSEYLYGQESFQQECDAEDCGAEVKFPEYFHTSSKRNVAMSPLSGFSLNTR